MHQLKRSRMIFLYFSKFKNSVSAKRLILLRNKMCCKAKCVHTKIKFLNRILKRNHRQDFNVQCGFQYSRYTFLGVHQFELT